MNIIRMEDSQEDDGGSDEVKFENNNQSQNSNNILDQETTFDRPIDTSYAQAESKKTIVETNDENASTTAEVATSSPLVASVSSTQQDPTGQPASESKFFAIRTTGGQERVVANLLQIRAHAKKLLIRSIIVLDSFKGYVIIEAPDSNVAYEALAGIRHVRGQIRGDLPFKDIEGYLVKKPVVSELSTNDTVEVIAGPFKSMKAKITRVDYEKQEATVVLLDSPYQIPVTVDANYLKKLAQ
jgi:transcription termination/antitermination protein NusG